MKLKRRKTEDGFLYIFWCPGCGTEHNFHVKEGGWEFNGDWDNPTFEPSLNLRGRCHLFLRDGVIDFLGDCRHHLKCKKVPLEDHWE